MQLTVTIPKTEALTLTKSMAMEVNMFVSGIRYIPGPPGEDGVGFRWLGDFSDRAVYVPNDVIIWPEDGNCYINILTCYGVLPSNPQYFEIFVSKGDKGDDGSFIGTMDDIVDGESYVKTQHNLPVNITVGTEPPLNPEINDLFIDTN